MVAMERPNPLNWGILTSMSIRNAVRRLVSEGRLIDHEPSVPAQRGKRRVYLSPTLQSLLGWALAIQGGRESMGPSFGKTLIIL